MSTLATVVASDKCLADWDSHINRLVLVASGAMAANCQTTIHSEHQIGDRTGLPSPLSDHPLLVESLGRNIVGEK